VEYKQQRQGDTVKVEIKDYTRRLIYRNKFNIRDKNALINLLQMLETYSGFTIIELIKMKIKSNWI